MSQKDRYRVVSIILVIIIFIIAALIAINITYFDLKINNSEGNNTKIEYLISSKSCLGCRKLNKVFEAIKDVRVMYVETDSEDIKMIHGSIPIKLPLMKLVNGKEIVSETMILEYFDTNKIVEEKSKPTLWLVIITAMIDSINVCAINCLIFIITLLSTRKEKIFRSGMVYVISIFFTYTLIGLAILFTSRELIKIPKMYTVLGVFIMSILIFAMYKITNKVLNLLNGEEVLVCEGGVCKLEFEEKSTFQKKIENFFLSKGSLILTGVFIAISEFACSGMMYIPTLVLINNNIDRVLLLLLYNLIFVIPLIIIIFIYKKVKKYINSVKDNKYILMLSIPVLLCLSIYTLKVYFL